MIDLTNKRFGRLLVLRAADRKSKVGKLWTCLCDCGSETVGESAKLRKGLKVSCGCYRSEILSAGTNKTHGRSKTGGTYKTWKEMRQRCNNPSNDKYKWYGGRGIVVCERWNNFEVFLSDMGERPPGLTLDRIDNDGPYSPENCRWLSQLEQTRRQKKNKLRGHVENMKEDRAKGLTYRQLADKYGVTSTAAHRAVTGVTWSRP